MKSIKRLRFSSNLDVVKSPQSTSASLEATSMTQPWSEVPQPTSYPLIGNAYIFFKKDIMTSMDKLHKELREKYGDTYKTNAFGDVYLNIHDPRDAQTLMNNEGSHPIIPGFQQLAEFRRTELPTFFSETTGLVSQGEEWASFRQLVQQDMMRSSSALLYIEELETIAEELVEKLAEVKNNEGEINVGEYMKEYALECTGEIFLGSRLGVLKGSETGKMMIEQFEIFTRASLPLFMYPLYISKWMPFYKEIKTASQKMLEISQIKIAEAQKTASNESVLIKLINKCGEDSNVPVAMALDAFSGGIDTTGNSATFLLYHLAKNPEKQEKLYQEICETIGKDGSLCAKSLSKMKYLKACQRESQRLLPVASGSARQTQVEMTLGGYDVPIGTKVIRWGMLATNCPSNFASPDLFLPERWIRGDCQYKKTSPYAFLPFGHGPRSCIGQRFAKLELYMVLAKVVQKFRLEYNGANIGLKTGLINAPDSDVVLRLTERQG